MPGNDAPARKTIRTAQPPDGFVYQTEFISPDEESALIQNIQTLPLKEFEFYGYLGKRRVASFGWQYDYGEARLKRAGEMPRFILPLRDKAGIFAGLKPEDLPHVLFTEYMPGTPIGWHRDRPVFDDVIGISLLSACPFRMRRRIADGWERYTHTVEPRSAYLISGVARRLWEHSIPPVDELRYSVTFRSLRKE
jgi:alkylated DNA repair dioxygenase AlkB